MRILYIGDVMGQAGLEAVERVLPGIAQDRQVDLVIAQAENVTDGKGISPGDFQRLQTAGVDFCTGGNHIFDNKNIYAMLDDPEQPIIRPANYPEGMPGLGWKYADTPKGRVLIVSLLGQIVGKQAAATIENPLKAIDDILHAEQDSEKVATIVNFHGDFSSEKVIIGHYLDGRVAAVIGDHWHVPTADARVLPKGTAHISDVGMCGVLNSSLGVTFDSVVPRWRDGIQTKNTLAVGGDLQFNAVLVETNDQGLATSIESINETILV